VAVESSEKWAYDSSGQLIDLYQNDPLCSNFCIKYGSHFTNDHVFCFGFHYYQVNLLKYFTISLIRYFSSSVKYLCDIREIFIRSMNVSLRLQYILATAFETIGNYMVNCSLINYLKYNNTSNEIHIYFVIVLSRSISWSQRLQRSLFRNRCTKLQLKFLYHWKRHSIFAKYCIQFDSCWTFHVLCHRFCFCMVGQIGIEADPTFNIQVCVFYSKPVSLDPRPYVLIRSF
jgi:hypothetical protein